MMTAAKKRKWHSDMTTTEYEDMRAKLIAQIATEPDEDVAWASVIHLFSLMIKDEHIRSKSEAEK